MTLFCTQSAQKGLKIALSARRFRLQLNENMGTHHFGKMAKKGHPTPAPANRY